MDTYRIKRNFLIKIIQFLGKTLRINLPPGPSVAAIIPKGNEKLLKAALLERAMAGLIIDSFL